MVSNVTFTCLLSNRRQLPKYTGTTDDSRYTEVSHINIYIYIYI